MGDAVAAAAWIVLGIVAACAQLPAGARPGEGSSGDGVEIVRFEPPRGALAPGDTAAARIVVRNRAREPREVWIGYSVGAPDGRWHDVPSHRVFLPGGGASDAEVKEWVVPDDAEPGSYRAVIGVWSSRPEEAAQPVRLATVEAADSFVVTWPGSALYPASHALGRGRVLPGKVERAGDGFRLALDGGRCDGAEIRTYERYGYGRFSASMRTPRAPGSLSALFLYEDVQGANDEIDIEIYNDGTRRVLLTAWSGGSIRHQTTVIVPFDPSGGVHEYSIVRLPDQVEIRIDGELHAHWRRGLPAGRMRVAVNVWWPVWLECRDGATGVLEVERLEISTR